MTSPPTPVGQVCQRHIYRRCLQAREPEPLSPMQVSPCSTCGCTRCPRRPYTCRGRWSMSRGPRGSWTGAKLASCVATRGRWRWGQSSITNWRMKQRAETVCPGECVTVLDRRVLHGFDPCVLQTPAAAAFCAEPRFGRSRWAAVRTGWIPLRPAVREQRARHWCCGWGHCDQGTQSWCYWHLITTTVTVQRARVSATRCCHSL